MAARVELLGFPDCPHLPAAREQLKRAFARLGREPNWAELDVTAADAPERVRGYGSPTILIDGVDISGQGPGDGQSCRWYAGSDLEGAPALEVVVEALRRAAP